MSGWPLVTRPRHVTAPKYARPAVRSMFRQFQAFLDVSYFIAAEDYALLLRLIRKEADASLVRHAKLVARIRKQYPDWTPHYEPPSRRTRLALWLLRRDRRKKGP